jgi:hypothetical protein
MTPWHGNRNPSDNRPLHSAILCFKYQFLHTFQTGSFPYSESLPLLGAKRSISHEHQKSSGLSSISYSGIAFIRRMISTSRKSLSSCEMSRPCIVSKRTG